MIELLKDQVDLIDSVKDKIRQGKRSVLIQAATGSGKTVVSSSIVHGAFNKGKSAIFIVPRRDLLRQTSETFNKFNIPHSFIAAGKHYNPKSQIHIASKDTLISRLDEIKKYDLAIVDECFVGETQINTIRGKKKIAKMRLGDVVYNATGLGIVCAISKKKVTEVYKVRLNDGTIFRCTGNHPFLSKQGWIECRKLVAGAELFDIQDMPRLWKRLSAEKKIQEKEWESGRVCPNKNRIHEEALLLNILLKEDRECNVGGWCCGKNDSNFKKNRSQAIYSWWERQVDEATRNDIGNSRRRMDTRISNQNINGAQKWNISELLQSRYWESSKENCDRIGRELSQREKGCFGQKERRSSNLKRVENIEIEKSNSGRYVYNIQVDGHPSFFANGILVHNCHFGGAGLDKIIQHLKRDSMLLGLSATPWDMAGKGMRHQYEDMVCGKSVGWLIDNNRLSKYKAFAPSHIDLSNIDIVGGDYAKGQLSEKMEADIVLIGNTVKHYKEHAYGRRGVTFCVSRKHSELVAQEYRNAGIPAVHMDGETPEEVRVKVAKAFARGEIMQLCNAELLTFGYDLSSVSGMDVCIEVINDCQPTKSLAKQLQKWGRGLRYDGSEHLFFDHANNFETHGLPCQDREWSLDERKKRKRDSDDERSIPVRQCSQCYHAHKPAPVCPSCGYVYPIQSRTAEEIDVKLSEVEIVREKKEKRMEVGKARTMEDLYRIANERGYAKGWCYRQAKLKGIRI